jgi:hypothetical protein
VTVNAVVADWNAEGIRTVVGDQRASVFLINEVRGAELPGSAVRS